MECGVTASKENHIENHFFRLPSARMKLQRGEGGSTSGDCTLEVRLRLGVLLLQHTTSVRQALQHR